MRCFLPVIAWLGGCYLAGQNLPVKDPGELTVLLPSVGCTGPGNGYLGRAGTTPATESTPEVHKHNTQVGEKRRFIPHDESFHLSTSLETVQMVNKVTTIRWLSTFWKALSMEWNFTTQTEGFSPRDWVYGSLLETAAHSPCLLLGCPPASE